MDHLLREADSIVRRMLPLVLEAQGEKPEAIRLRKLPSLMNLNHNEIYLVCSILKDIRTETSRRKTPLGRATRWCEAAVRAASRGDMKSFKNHVDRATSELRMGIPGKMTLN